MRLGDRVSLEDFEAALSSDALEVPDTVYERLSKARDVVDRAAQGEAPVYGLNTGLGANLGHRLTAQDIPAFQNQLIEGRAVAVGPLCAAESGRAVLLARLIGAARGHSGMSPPLFDHLCAVYRHNPSPGIPSFGSIGASDLTQNASWALAVLGQGPVWTGGQWCEAAEVFADLGLSVPALQPKDAMALINHGALSVAQAGLALAATRRGFRMCLHAAVMAFEGFGANPGIFAPDIQAIRQAPGQAATAEWFRAHLTVDAAPRRVQDALSFRTLAPVLGAAQDALTRAASVWEDELNGASDNPAVLGAEAMCSTPNFHAPGLALALEQVSLAMAMVAQGSAMRIQRLMDPDLTGLPRYLSPEGGASAGFVPVQKTAAALLAEVRRLAMPVAFDPAPVSDGVEDMAPMTAQAARKLGEQGPPLALLAGAEALVAAQAQDLRGLAPTPLHQALRAQVAFLQEDRPLGTDIALACDVLAQI